MVMIQAKIMPNYIYYSLSAYYKINILKICSDSDAWGLKADKILLTRACRLG